MSVPVFIESTNGQFSASVVGAPELRCVGPSRDEAIQALQRELTAKITAGELINLDVGFVGVSGLAGRFRDDQSLLEIRDEIYRDRDADRK